MNGRDVERFFRVMQQEGLGEAIRRAGRKWSTGAEGAAEYRRWIALTEPDEEALLLQRQERRKGPLLSFLCPAFDTKEAHARALVRSLLSQTYGRWELCVADGSERSGARRLWQELSALDGRIRVIPLSQNEGIAKNTAAAARQARGEIFAFVDHDDELAPFAAYVLANCALDHPEADFFYSDEDKIDRWGRFDPHFKPEWSPDTLRSFNYITHLMAMRRSLYERCGGLRAGFDGSQDHDLALRATEKAEGIVHIPMVLYHWRAHSGSVARDGAVKRYAGEAGRRAVQAAVQREGNGGGAQAGKFENSYRAVYPIDERALLSILIPNRDSVELLRPCIDSIYATKGERHVEILVLENGSKKEETARYYDELRASGRARILSFEGPFHYSAVNNLGAREAKGSLLLFLNNDVRALSAGWIEAMEEQALRPEVGAVGAKLLYGDGTVQHAGVVVGLGGWADHICAHAPADGGGRYGCSHLINAIRNVSAVTGACLMCERSKLERAGGFDERFVLCGSDVALCLKLLELGYRNVYTPFACLRHLESVTRKDKPIPAGDFRFSREVYEPYLKTGDPYYSIHLDYQSKLPRVRAYARQAEP